MDELQNMKSNNSSGDQSDDLSNVSEIYILSATVPKHSTVSINKSQQVLIKLKC